MSVFEENSYSFQTGIEKTKKAHVVWSLSLPQWIWCLSHSMSSLWISMKIIAAHLYVMRLSFNLFTSTSSEESYSSPCSGCTQLKTNMIKSAPKAHHYVDIREEYLWKQISILGCTCQSVWPGAISFTPLNIHFNFCGNWKHCKTSKICLIWNKCNKKFGLTWPRAKNNEL